MRIPALCVVLLAGCTLWGQGVPDAPSASIAATQFQPAQTVAYSSSRYAFPPPAMDPDPAIIPGSPSPVVPRPDPIVSVERPQPKEEFHWKPALWQSARFLVFMHAFRLATEPSTRAELKGPFFGDYFDSVLGTGGWRDGDPRMVNYIGHPMEGAVSGFIFLQNDDAGRKTEFDFKSKKYWKTRLWSTAWMTAYSLQFELGPLSEASIGNVGKVSRADGGSYMASVDLVVTPTIGFAQLVGEDMLDKYAVLPIERKTTNLFVRGLARSLLNPSRSFANLMRIKPPWFRDSRPIHARPAEALPPAPPLQRPRPSLPASAPSAPSSSAPALGGGAQ